MESLVVPCIIANTQAELDEMVNKVIGKVKRINLDVMDGKFVSNTSLDFDFKVPPGPEYEAHLMVMNPLEWVKENAHKIDIAIIQVETLDNIGKAVEYVKNLNLKVSLALNPETPVDVVLPYVDQVDAFQVLTVHPGTFCIEFLPEPIEKIKRLREINDTIPIEADGCLNPEHIRLAKSAGANIFCSGSYIFKSDDVDKAIKELVEAAQ